MSAPRSASLAALRWPIGLAIALLALLLQISILPQLTWHGIVPNLMLLIVVAVGLTRGPAMAMLAGFAAGLALDLLPPAGHVAGRWALALVLVGYVAARTQVGRRPSLSALIGTVAAASFVGTSTYALTGLALGESALHFATLLQVIAVSWLWDVALTPVLVPGLLRLFTALTPLRAMTAATGPAGAMR